MDHAMSHDFNNLAGGLAGDIFVLIEELQQRVATIEVGPRDAGSKSPADENNDTPPWSLGALGEMI